MEDTLEDKVVRIGTSVTFTCIVRNPEEVHVKWIKRSNVNLKSNGLQLDEGLPYGVRLGSDAVCFVFANLMLVFENIFYDEGIKNSDGF